MKTKALIATVRGHSLYTRLLDEKSVIVDLGAHKGEFSIEMSTIFGCKCYMVEALPSLCAQIGESQLLKIYNYAMASSDEQVVLFISQNLEGNTTSGSTAAGSEDSVIVDGVTLDTLMTRADIKMIDLLKMDIEGAEVDLFSATSDEVLLNITQITVEFHDFVPDGVSAKQVTDIKNRLQDLGFYVINFSRLHSQDVLFINQRLSGMSTVEYMYIKYVLKYSSGIIRIFQKWISAK